MYRFLSLVTGLLLSTTATAQDLSTSKNTQDLPEYLNSLTLQPFRTLWPAVGVEYERKLDRRHGLSGGLTLGRWNPLWLRAMEAELNTTGKEYPHFNTINVSATYNFYFKDFSRGWYTGAGLNFYHIRYKGPSMISEMTAESDDDNLSNPLLDSLQMGPHIGWKISTQTGFTFSVDGGLVLLDYVVSSEKVLLDEKETLTKSRTPFMGSVNIGWSF